MPQEVKQQSAVVPEQEESQCIPQQTVLRIYSFGWDPPSTQNREGNRVEAGTSRGETSETELLQRGKTNSLSKGR